MSTSPAQAFGDEPESLAIRLVRIPSPELPVEVRKQLRIPGKPARQGPRRVMARSRRGDRLGKAGGNGFVAAEDVIRLDPERPLGDLGGHGGVPVAVPADPRVPA